MGEVVPIGGVPARTPGQDLFGAVMDSLDASGIRLPRATIAVAVRHGAAALKDGVDPQAVLAGCLAALLQNKGRYAADFITDMALLKAGRHMSRDEYAAEIARQKRGSGQSLYEAVKRMADSE